MVINVNKSTDRVEIPTVVLRGKEVSEDGETTGSLRNYTITNDIAEDSTVSGNWRNQDEMRFYGSITVTIISDPKYTSNDYSRRSVGDIVGAVEMVDNKIGMHPSGGTGTGSDTYYTLNGKNPKRTKSTVYTGAFTIRRNESGSDNCILKVRTYYNGSWSEVFKTEFRISRDEKRLI